MSHYTLDSLQTLDLVIDDLGVLYFHENRVLRGINASQIGHVKYLFESGFLPELIEKKMFPNSWVCEDSIEGYDLVIEHAQVKPWNYPYEWSFTMLRDAALLVLELTETANRYDLCLVDGHYYNVTFDKCSPIYVDLGSFRKRDSSHDGWLGFSDFYHSFFVPLKLWEKGLYTVVRNTSLAKTLFDEAEFNRIRYGFLPEPIINVLNKLSKKRIRVLEASKSVVLTRLEDKKLSSFVYKWISPLIFHATKPRGYIRKISKLTAPNKETMWTHYHSGRELNEEPRFRRIIEIIKTLDDCDSLVEVAANHGKLSLEIAKQTDIKKIISTDYDETAVDTMYLLAKKTNAISPLVVNASLPNGRITDEKVTVRVKSDLAIGLAITHHLVLTQGFPLKTIFKQFEEIANKYVIIEFMPLGLYAGDLEKTPPLPDYYSLAWFRDTFSSVFELILDEELEENRHVFVGKIVQKPMYINV